MQSPGAARLDDHGYLHTLRGYVTGVLSQFRTDDRILGWDLWNEPDNPADAYASVQRTGKLDRVAELLPQVFAWARSVDPCQPLTSGVWQGEWADPARRSVISGIQLDNSDVITFHCYGEPAAFEKRIADLVLLGRPILCTEYMARPLGSTVQTILPIAKRANVGAFNWVLVAGKTQTYFPWDSWEHPDPAMPREWFHDLLDPDGRPFRDSEIQTIARAERSGDASAATADRLTDLGRQRQRSWKSVSGWRMPSRSAGVCGLASMYCLSCARISSRGWPFKLVK